MLKQVKNNRYPRLMKILSMVGILIFFALPLGMLFIGFSDITVDCVRQQPGKPPDCEIRESRFFGLFERQAAVSAVSAVGYRTHFYRHRSSASLASSVVLDGKQGDVAISQFTSNVGAAWKSDLIMKMQRFLDMPNNLAISIKIKEQNLFGWIGAVLVVFTIISYIGWFLRKLKGRC